MNALIEQRDHLLQRLEAGDRRIREAEATGKEVPSTWDDHWISLLRQYEAACRDLGAYAHAAYPVRTLKGGPDAH